MQIRLNGSKTAIAGLRILDKYVPRDNRNYLGDGVYEVDAPNLGSLLSGELGKYFRIFE